MNATVQKPVVIEVRHRTGAYDMLCTDAIVEHPKHGRIYLCEGWGGDSIHGEMYRWRHGTVCRLQPADTLAGLDAKLTEIVTLREAMIQRYDAERPVLDWSGAAIAALAKRCGL